MTIVLEPDPVEEDEVALVPLVAIAGEAFSPEAAGRRDDVLAASLLLQQLGALLAWIAPGRTVTRTGGLRRGDFAAAAATVGATVPAGRVTAMWDIGHLGELWRVAASAGLIDLRPASVRLTPAGRALLEPDSHPTGDAATSRERAVIAFLTLAMTRPSPRHHHKLEPPTYAGLYDLEPHLIALARGERRDRSDLLRDSSPSWARLLGPDRPDRPDPRHTSHHVEPAWRTLMQWGDFGLATTDGHGPEAAIALLPEVVPLAATALLAVLGVDTPGLPTLADLVSGTWPDPPGAPEADRPPLVHRLRVDTVGPQGPVRLEVTVDGQATMEDVHVAIATAFGRSPFGAFTLTAPTLAGRTITWLSEGLEIDRCSDRGTDHEAWAMTLSQAVRASRGPWTYRHDVRHGRTDTVTVTGTSSRAER